MKCFGIRHCLIGLKNVFFSYEQNDEVWLPDSKASRNKSHPSVCTSASNALSEPLRQYFDIEIQFHVNEYDCVIYH